MYIPPEVLKRRDVVSLFPIDVYALGMVMHLMWTKMLPIREMEEHFLSDSAMILPKQKSEMPECVQHALRGMLEADPTHRWTLHQVRAVLDGC